MKLRVEVEGVSFDLAVQPHLNVMVDKALSSDTLDECYDKFLDYREKNNMHISFGRGGSHIWISYKNRRKYLITER